VLKAFLAFTTSCLANCPDAVMGSGRMSVVLGMITACCRHTSLDVVRSGYSHTTHLFIVHAFRF
jgi:hypothetical protein